MPPRCWLPLGPVLVLLVARAAAQASDASALARQLGSPQFAERERAARALDQLDCAALPALYTARQDADPEVRRRAAALVQKIEERRVAAEILAPRPFRFRYVNEPLTKVLRDLEVRTGLRPWLPLKHDWGRRAVTVDTGERPFWLAWDDLCRAAGVADTALWPGSQITSYQRRTDDEPRALLLAFKDATDLALPTDRGGAFRVRLWRHAAAAVDGETGVRFDVEIRPDPRLHVLALRDVRFDALTDARGRPLPARDPTPAVAAALDLPFHLHLTTNDRDNSFRNGVLWPVAVGGLRPPVKLGRVQGRFTADVQVTRPVVVVEGLRGAVGRTTTVDGITLKVLRADRTETGDLAVRVHLGGLGGLFDPRAAPATRRLRSGAVVIRGSAEMALELLEGQDAQGRPLVRTAAHQEPAPGGGVDCDVTFQAPPTSGDVRLVLRGQRVVSLPVDFTLRDVDLP